NEVCETDFSLKKIKNIYKHSQNGEKKGLKSLGDIVEANKIPINKKAFKNLVKHYKETHDESIFDKDIFKVLDKIIDMAIFNPLPINTKHSMSNVSELGVYLMNGKDIYKRDKYEL
ncbi:hypothetical protein, partial [uncultured Methanobrevibacter sp.]|uniref:hypothetical protein n=1 Tax=uncultured Methanobrevibacter sp. TaxID=253161 RepID=UPI0025E35902